MKRTAAVIWVLLFAYSATYAQRRKIDSLQQVLSSLPDSTKMDACLSLGKNYINISIDSATQYLYQALELSKKFSAKSVEAKSYSLLGVAEKNRGNYDKAITYHLNSLKLNEALGEEHAVAVSYNDMGVLYKIMNRFDDALMYYRKSNELCRKTHYPMGIAMTYNNIGTIMKVKAMPDSAISYYKLALSTAEALGDGYSISTCLANIGETYEESKHYAEALQVFKKCLQYDKKNEDKDGMESSYVEIAQALAGLNNYALARKYADSAYRICAEEKLMTGMLEVLRIQAELYKKMGNTREALAIMEKYAVIKDTVMNQETAKQVAEYQTRYETEKKEKEIITLRQQQEITALRLSRQDLRLQNTRYQMLAVIGIMLLLAIVAYLLYSRQQIKQRQARERAVIAAEYNERLRIAKDVHDDLGSGLSKISLMANMAQQRAGTYNPALGNDIHHIASVSKELIDNMRDLIWVLNPENTTLDNLVARLREYCADYLDGMDIDFDLDFPVSIPGMRISRETQRNIFSTVKESINNCVKHAAATHINIALRLENEIFTVTVSDNGHGFEMGDLKGSGNGLRNMKQRIAAVGGSFTIISAVGTGTSANITVPFARLHLQNTTIV